MLEVKVISPENIIYESKTVVMATLPTTEGEITILPKHVKILTHLSEGIMKFKDVSEEEKFFAIGSGYARTDGKNLEILVSRVYKEDELNEHLVEEAIASAQKLVSEAKDEKTRREAIALLKQSNLNLKILRRRKQQL